MKNMYDMKVTEEQIIDEVIKRVDGIVDCYRDDIETDIFDDYLSNIFNDDEIKLGNSLLDKHLTELDKRINETVEKYRKEMEGKRK